MSIGSGKLALRMIEGNFSVGLDRDTAFPAISYRNVAFFRVYIRSSAKLFPTIVVCGLQFSLNDRSIWACVGAEGVCRKCANPAKEKGKLVLTPGRAMSSELPTIRSAVHELPERRSRV